MAPDALYGFRRRAHLVEDERKALAFVRRLAFDVEELDGVRHRIEDDHKIRRQLQRKLRLPAGRKLDRIKRDFLDQPIEVIWKIDRRAPEYLAKILRERKLVGIMRRDPAHPPADRECHLDDLVERQRITRRAPGAVIL
jgi:hypothetical protein